MEDFVIVDKKKLRRGYTTGSCAAAAAQAAAFCAISGSAPRPRQVTLVTPKGVTLVLEVGMDCPQPGGSEEMPAATCYVEKDSGDDPDVTNGIRVFATVTMFPGKWDNKVKPELFRQLGNFGAAEMAASNAEDVVNSNGPDFAAQIMNAHPGATVTQSDGLTVFIDGGVGIGRVTKPGLACRIGQAAINPVPRRMIDQEVRRAADELGYQGILLVEISIPQGVEVAKKTYNPRLGIEGGISVLGTSGIVEPMSEQALIDTIQVEMNMRCAEGGEYLLLTPGNYGETFLKETMGLGDIYTVKCSNFLGESLDYAEQKGVKGILLVSHIGKLVKVAAGIMNTHSRYGDARLEVLSAHAALQGAGQDVIRELMQAVTTDDGLTVLSKAGLREQTLASVLEKVQYHLEERTNHSMKIGAVMFSNQYGYLGQTKTAEELIRLL